MKKSLLFVTTVLGAVFTMNAQTLSFSSQTPTDGDDIPYEIVDVDAFGFCFDPAGSGPVTDKLWDARECASSATAFSTLGVQHVVFTDASTTTYASDFPKANFAISYTGYDATTGYEYYRYAGDSITRLGFTDAAGPQLWYVDNTFDASFPRYIFPINPGDNWGSTYVGGYKPMGLGEDSVKVENGQYSAEAIAVGTLILPPASFGATGEQFDDVVLMKITESFKINIYLLGTPLNALTLDEEYYAWFKDGVQEPLMIYYETTENTSALGGTVTTNTKMRYQALDGTEPPTGINSMEFSAFSLYPNPTNGELNITLKGIDFNTTSIKILNVLGEEVMNVNGGLVEYNTFDLSQFDAGIYSVQVTSDGRTESKRLIIK